MQDVFHLVVVSILLVRKVGSIRCHRCTSVVEVECEQIYMFFTTYGFMKTELEADCGPSYNACVVYVFASDNYDADAHTVKFYIQRGCGTLPKEQECDSVEANLAILNVTIFDKISNCHVCNTSLCNNMPIQKAIEWFTDRATLHYPLALILIAVLILIAHLL